MKNNKREFSMAQETISIVLPCYNEKDNILFLIEKISNILYDRKIQLIVVDDNSPDGTYAVVANKKFEHVKTILRKDDASLAKSIRTGIENADGEIIVVMDTDFNHCPEELPVMLMNLEFYDCVLASRFLYGSKMDNRFRQFASWMFNIFVRVVTRKYITDSLFGYFAIKKSVLQKINYDDIFWGYGDYCIRLMYHLQKAKINILQVPATLGKRKSGSGNNKLIRTFFQYTKETLKLVFK